VLLVGDWRVTGGVLNITAADWTAGFHWWRSGNITRTPNVSEYMLVLALCLVLTSGQLNPLSNTASGYVHCVTFQCYDDVTELQTQLFIDILAA